MGIDISEIRGYLDKFSRQLGQIRNVDFLLEQISEQLEEIKNLLIMISRKIK